jgi:hypothetical protein
MSVELLAALDPPSPLQHPAETQLHAFGAGAAARLGRQVCRDHTLAGGGWAAPDQAESSRFTTRCMGQSRQHLVEPAITLGRHIGALVTGDVTAGDSGDPCVDPMDGPGAAAPLVIARDASAATGSGGDAL